MEVIEKRKFQDLVKHSFRKYTKILFARESQSDGKMGENTPSLYFKALESRINSTKQLNTQEITQ